jgi:hypothetical protein
LKLNGTHQLLAYADDVNILGKSIGAVKENAEALVVAAKEIGLEVNADKTKYMVMSRDQNAGRTHSMKIDNGSFERVDEFKYLGTTFTNQNSIQKEIKSRLKSGNACCHSVQNLLSSRLLSKNLKINPLNAELIPICHLLALLGAHLILHFSRIRVKVYKNIILPVFYGFETWSLTLREERRLRVF